MKKHDRKPAVWKDILVALEAEWQVIVQDPENWDTIGNTTCYTCDHGVVIQVNQLVSSFECQCPNMAQCPVMQSYFDHIERGMNIMLREQHTNINQETSNDTIY